MKRKKERRRITRPREERTGKKRQKGAEDRKMDRRDQGRGNECSEKSS